MKRSFALLLALALLLSFAACKKNKTVIFSVDADGYGITDTKTGVHYTALPPTFEPLALRDAVGVTEEGARSLTFYEIDGLDPAQFLSDGEGTVYTAGEVPDAANAVPTGLTVFEREAISVELARFDENHELTAALLTFWFSGQDTELPFGETPRRTLALRWTSERFKGLTFGVLCAHYEGGSYLYDVYSKRAVEIPAYFIEDLDL